VPDITLRRTYRLKFLEQVWERTWALPGFERHIPTLQRAQACSAYAIDDPFAIVAHQGTITTYTCAGGDPLSSRLTEARDEACLRHIGEQLCHALLRLHKVQEIAHGSVRPFNIILGSDGVARLWSIPSARLEPKEMRNDLYRAPELGRGTRGSIAGDIFSVGAVLSQASGSASSVSDSFRDILRACSKPDPISRFKNVVDLAMALNPQTRLASISVADSTIHKLRGLQAFKDDRVPEACEYWESALVSDPLDLTILNNLAVAKAQGEAWMDAVSFLEKAYELFRFHPVVDLNIGYCMLNLGDLKAAEFWFNRAIALNPWLSLPYRLSSQMALMTDSKTEALRTARESVRLAPTSPGARRQLARAYEASGDPKAKSQREYAKGLLSRPALFEHLIKPDDEPPWGPIRRMPVDRDGPRLRVKRPEQ
jgi:tetratricopeptide (TPR) repeat protein